MRWVNPFKNFLNYNLKLHIIISASIEGAFSGLPANARSVAVEFILKHFNLSSGEHIIPNEVVYLKAWLHFRPGKVINVKITVSVTLAQMLVYRWRLDWLRFFRSRWWHFHVLFFVYRTFPIVNLLISFGEEIYGLSLTERRLSLSGVWSLMMSDDWLLKIHIKRAYHLLYIYVCKIFKIVARFDMKTEINDIWSFKVILLSLFGWTT